MNGSLRFPRRRRPDRARSCAVAFVAAGLAGTLLGPASAAALASASAAPAAAITGELAGVSCVSASSCLAVGVNAPLDGPSTPLAEKWNGATWTASAAPSPASATNAAFYAVTCTAAANCLAVGSYFIAASHQALPLAEKWNGSKWTIQAVPAPSGVSQATLLAVACPAATSCRATGNAGTKTLAENWNGSKWSIVPSANANSGKPNVLSGLACSSASSCWSVGYWFPGSDTGSLTEKWNGSKWTVVSTPSTSSGQLISTACASASDCLAVGLTDKLFGLAQRWNGSTWTNTKLATVVATSTELNSVTCVSTTACESVGSYSTSSNTGALAEKWAGTKWTLQKTPAINGSSYATLDGISCASASYCWAVGMQVKSSGTSAPLLEKWNGSAWSIPG